MRDEGGPPRLERDRNAVERLSENRVAGRTPLTVCVRRSLKGEGGRPWRGVCVSDEARRAEEDADSVTGPRIDEGVKP